MQLLRMLFTRRRPLRQSELDLINAVLAEYPPEFRARLDHQLELVNFVHREKKTGEVRMYHLRWGDPSSDHHLQIGGAPEEFRLGVVTYQDEEGTTGKCDLWLAHGRLFSLEFFGAAIPDSGVEIISVQAFQAELQEEVLASSAGRPSELELEGRVRGWLGSSVTYELSQIVPPTNGPVPLERFPADLRTLSEICSQFTIQGWRVLSLQAASRVMVDGRHFHLVALGPDGHALAITEGDSEGMIFRLDHELTYDVVGSGFRETLLQELRDERA